MGLTQKLGTIPLAILTDTSNNVGIGGSPSGSYKLEVTGTAKVSSTLLVSGAATLTGALSGTSATFSGNLEVFSGSSGVTVGDFLVNPTTKYVYVGRQSSTSGDNTIFVVRDRTGSARATIPGGGSIDTVFSTNNSNFIVSNYSGNSLMTIANTGAATFSSSVTTTDLNVFDTYANDPLIKLASTTSGNVEVQMRTATTTYNAGIGVVTSGYDFNIFTNNSTKMTITSGGNVGIGTSSPATTLHALGPIRSQDSRGGSLAAVEISGGSASANPYISVDQSNPLTFITGATERMRITSDGNVGVGITGVYSNVRLMTRGVDATASNYAFRAETSAAANLMYIRNDGLIVTGLLSGSPYNYTTGSAANMYVSGGGELQRSTSSLKYKTDVKDYDKGLSEVLQMRPVYYKGKNDGDTQFAGLIAEEVHELGLTEFVQYAEDGTPDALAYSNMIALLTKAIQEQNQTIQSLQEQINILAK